MEQQSTDNSGSVLRVLVVGAGHMGTSHARAYAAIPDFELCGIVSRGESGAELATEIGGVEHFRDFDQALAETRPEVGYDGVVCVEHEDRDFEATDELVKRGFLIARDAIAPWIH